MIKIRYKKPPFWRIIKLFFPEYDPNGSVAVAFGKVVYANSDFTDDYKAHEAEHLKQHHHSYFIASLWWIAYLLSKRFRYKQELGAFRAQYRFALKDYRFHKNINYYLDHYAGQLSSELYGALVSKKEARKAIIEEYD